ncbi:MAG: glycosyltransferase [Pirellulaceae bacterium]
MARPYNVLLMAGTMMAGGSERQTLYLLRHLDRTKFTPHLYLSYAKGELLEQVPDDVSITSFDAQPTAFLDLLPGFIHRRQVAGLRRYLVEESIDIVYDRTFHMSLIAGPAVQGLRTRRMATIVSPPDQDLPAAEQRFVGLKRRLLSRSYHRADAIVTVSEAVAASAARYYRIPPERFQTIHSPIDLEAIADAASDDLCGDIQLDSVDVNIACVGRMTNEKGQRYLIDAIAALRDHPVFDCLHVWMVGDGPMRQDLIQQAEQLDLRRRIHFVGCRASAIPLMARCQLVCVPSLYEGFPMCCSKRWRWEFRRLQPTWGECGTAEESIARADRSAC